ncbi:DUF4232 domain-containing protein [Streptomyces dangxiongensis]|uniref:DUF4232 domain-containing protein n=1 Tax=Streptomyces dangxiongensis TaxID=1442032 RepID=A0A3G2J8V8_9ACTN|nr:DUF4232 domain-containing protein [Streptomyces dangxiongensis]AYN38698.1 DUF4232 domain-containing protein [Streptomyces dangxiongensis]
MRATIRPAGGPAVLTATLALALTACGTTTTAAPDATAPPTTSPSATAPPCRTAALTWTLSLTGGGTGEDDGRPNARLTAVNKGPGNCAFAGYPGLEIHQGKADGIEGAGDGHPASLTLPGRAAVAVDLRYTPRGTKGAGTWCVRQNEAVVRAPHDTHGTVVPVTDEHRRPATIDACGETLAMAAPRRAPAGT